MYMTDNKDKNGRLNTREMYLNFPRISLCLDNPCILKGKIDPQKEPEFYSMVEKWKFEDHSKLEVVTSLLEKFIDTEGKKTILWSGHPMSIKQLGEYYKKYNPILIHGEIEIPKGVTRDEYRDGLIEKFKKQKKHKLLIASYRMIARAVNIVEAPRAICFDRPWDFEIWDQMSKRNHRIGTTERVLMRPIVFENTIEERQDRVLENRERLDKDLFKYDSLSKDQWESIFEGKEL
jgi:SNF2 family DNA or RNA helicase